MTPLYKSKRFFAKMGVNLRATATAGATPDGAMHRQEARQTDIGGLGEPYGQNLEALRLRARAFCLRGGARNEAW